MPNGINYELDFKKRIGEMGDRQLLEFVAEKTFDFAEKCKGYDKSIASLEMGDRKASSIVGGISGTITSIIIGIIGYFTNRS